MLAINDQFAEVAKFHSYWDRTSCSLTNCLGQDLGGDTHRLSPRTNAQTPCISYLAQMSGLVCRHSYVCFSVSSG